jgi:hypothetical protein
MQVEGGWALEISTYLVQMALASLIAISWPNKVSISRAQPPPTCPRNGSARLVGGHINNEKLTRV